MQLPIIFGGSPEGIETVCNLLSKNASASDPVTLDFSQVPWIRPYGALMLLLACQHPYQHTNLPVELISVPPRVRLAARECIGGAVGSHRTARDKAHPIAS